MDVLLYRSLIGSVLCPIWFFGHPSLRHLHQAKHCVCGVHRKERCLSECCTPADSFPILCRACLRQSVSLRCGRTIRNPGITLRGSFPFLEHGQQVHPRLRQFLPCLSWRRFCVSSPECVALRHSANISRLTTVLLLGEVHEHQCHEDRLELRRGVLKDALDLVFGVRAGAF